MSNFNSGMQWDEPFGWSPTNWIANDGLAVAGFREDARRIAQNFDATIDKGFAADGTIVEKYNVDAVTPTCMLVRATRPTRSALAGATPSISR